MWSKGNSCALLVGMQMGAASMEISMVVSQKVKKENCCMIQHFHFWVFYQRK